MKERVKLALVQFAPEWLQRERDAERVAAGAEKVYYPLVEPFDEAGLSIPRQPRAAMV